MTDATGTSVAKRVRGRLPQYNRLLRVEADAHYPPPPSDMPDAPHWKEGHALTDRVPYSERYDHPYYPMPDQMDAYDAGFRSGADASSNRAVVCLVGGEPCRVCVREGRCAWDASPNSVPDEPGCPHEGVPCVICGGEGEDAISKSAATDHAAAPTNRAGCLDIRKDSGGGGRATRNRVQRVADLQRFIQNHPSGPDSPTAAFGLANGILKHLEGE